jgi:transcription elongation factor Elf1
LAAKRRQRRRHLIKEQAVAYKGGKCIHCGYSRCIAALEFHHRDPNRKEFLITGSGKSFALIKTELDKTDLVCANCHREIESG